MYNTMVPSLTLDIGPILDPTLFFHISRPVDLPLFGCLQLLSVICIETSHYVCFTRLEDQWLFHDSMADRMCECMHENNYS